MKLSLRQAAGYLNVDESTVRRWIAERGLPVHRVDERLHLNAIEVWEWAVEQGLPASRSLLQDARRSPEPTPLLSRLLEVGGVHRDSSGTTKDAVLADLVRQLPLPQEVDREHLLAILEAREAMGSTGIGEGIAIPHVRNPVLLHVEQPFVSLFLLRHPVDFDSIDGQPVHAIFVLVTSSVPEHLRILAELSFVLHDTRLRDLLRDRAPTPQLLARVRELEVLTTGQFAVRSRPA